MTLGSRPANAAMIEAPEQILGFIASYADVDGFECRKCFFPGISPLDGDAVTYERDIDGALCLPRRFLPNQHACQASSCLPIAS